MAKHPFLSDEWFSQAEQLVAAHTPEAPAQANVRINLVITDTPFDQDVQMHMGAKDGKGEWGKGHTDGADVTLTTDYGTAKDIFVSGNPQAGMQAFMAGKVKVQGDMAKLMAAQQGGGPANPALSQALQDITA
ncbi:MAG: SCP2 sterol-binding domain-containing protein [Acidimicrobiia bacterium]